MTANFIFDGVASKTSNNDEMGVDGRALVTLVEFFSLVLKKLPIFSFLLSNLL